MAGYFTQANANVPFLAAGNVALQSFLQQQYQAQFGQDLRVNFMVPVTKMSGTYSPPRDTTFVVTPRKVQGIALSPSCSDYNCKPQSLSPVPLPSIEGEPLQVDDVAHNQLKTYELLQDRLSVHRNRPVRPVCCNFCKNAGRPFDTYSRHNLKDGNGIVTCPLLRSTRCQICGATGDFAHTTTQCPQNADCTARDRAGRGKRQKSETGRSVQSSSESLD